MIRYIILLLLFSCGLSAQTKLRQIERSATKWYVPAAWDSIPGVTGHAMKYIDLETLMDTVGIQQFGIDSIIYRNDSLLIYNGPGYYFAIIPQGLSGAGDDGSVAYWHQDTIAGDTVHFWDRTNKRLGLNTKSPTSLLHVKKNEFSLPVAEFDNPGTNGQTVLIKHGASTDARYPLKIQTPASTTYFDARGYLGLGTSPGYPLHVYGSNGISRFENSGANGDAGFDIRNGNKWWRIALNAEGGTTNNVHFRDVTGGRYPITLQSSNGYVGILNLTPARELHVTGRVRVSTLDSDLTPPTTAGPTKMVITDESGDLSFANIPSGGGPDSTNIIGGWGIESTESPANTFNLIADSTQVASQYDLTLKQDKITGGTTNRVTKFTSASTIGNSQIQDNGTTVGIGALNASYKFYVNSGNMKLGDDVVSGSLNKLYFGNGTFVYVGEGAADDRLYLRGTTLAVDINGSTGTAGQVLTSSGSGTATWSTPTAGAGTVTSVGVNVGTGLTVTPSGSNPITTSGTFTLANTANLTLTSTSNPTINTNTAGAVSGIQLVGSNGITISGNTNTKVVTITGSGGAVTNLSFAALNNGGTPNTNYGDYIPLESSTGADVNLREGDGLDLTRNSSNFSGYKLSQTYGQLSAASGATTAITTTETKINFNISSSNGKITTSTANDNITVDSAGTYQIELQINLNGTSNRNVAVALFLNNTGGQNFSAIQTVNNSYQTMYLNKILTMSAGQAIDFRINYDNTTGSGTDINYYRPVLIVKRLK